MSFQQLGAAIALLERGVVALESIAKSLKAGERVAEIQASPKIRLSREPISDHEIGRIC